MAQTLARLIGFRSFVCAAIVAIWAVGERAFAAEPLLLLTDASMGDRVRLDEDKAPGYNVELVEQVLAGMGQEVSFEPFPTNRAWRMMLRGEADGMLGVLRTAEREQICFFPDEPLSHERWTLFVRAADVGRLKFSSLDDLIGHDVAVREPVPGLFKQPTVSTEMWQFLVEHHNMVETNSFAVSLRMLAAGRVDYAVVSLTLGKRATAAMGLRGRIEPLPSSDVIDGGIYTCFGKVRVKASFVDALSRALKQFKQTEAYQVIIRKYSP